MAREETTHPRGLGYPEDTAAPSIITDPDTSPSTGNTTLICDTDAAGGNITVQLPTVTNATVYNIKKLGTSGNVIVKGGTIDDATIATLTTEYENMQILSDGTVWYVI